MSLVGSARNQSNNGGAGGGYQLEMDGDGRTGRRQVHEMSMALGVRLSRVEGARQGLPAGRVTLAAQAALPAAALDVAS